MRPAPHPAPDAPPAVPARSGWPRLGLFLLVVLMAGVTGRYAQTFASGADESGYLHEARLIREGRWVGDVRPVGDLPLEALSRPTYQALGFEVAEDLSRQMPTYPLGLPLALAALGRLWGEPAGAWWTLVLLAASLPLLMYQLARDQGCGPGRAVLAAAVLASSPLVWFVSLRPLSDGLSLVLVTACLVVARRAGRGVGWALGLGFLVGWAVLTRLPNAMVVLPVLALLLPRWRDQRWWAIAAGGLPSATVLLSVNQALYGSPWSSGYIGVGELFRWSYLPGALAFFGWWTGVMLSPFLLLGAVVALVRGTRSGRGFAPVPLVLWIGGFAVFYGLYRHSQDDWSSLRFVLPAWPAVVVLGVAGVAAPAGRGAGSVRGRTLLAGLGAVAILGWNAAVTRRLITFETPARDPYVQFVGWSRAHLRPADVCVGMQVSGCLYYHLPNAWVRYDHLDSAAWGRVRAAVARQGGVIYAPLFRFEVDAYGALAQGAPGDWEVVTTFGELTLYRLRAP